jgi:hypothetical protein
LTREANVTTKKRAKKQDSPSAGAEKKKTEQVKTWAQISVATETHKYLRRESGVSP